MITTQQFLIGLAIFMALYILGQIVRLMFYQTLSIREGRLRRELWLSRPNRLLKWEEIEPRELDGWLEFHMTGRPLRPDPRVLKKYQVRYVRDGKMRRIFVSEDHDDVAPEFRPWIEAWGEPLPEGISAETMRRLREEKERERRQKRERFEAWLRAREEKRLRKETARQEKQRLKEERKKAKPAA